MRHIAALRVCSFVAGRSSVVAVLSPAAVAAGGSGAVSGVAA
jgi:hypothetical protein